MNDPQWLQLLRDRWAGATLRGGLPRAPQRTALPTASAELEGCIVLIVGASGAASVLYVCLKGTADTYSWKAVATG